VNELEEIIRTSEKRRSFGRIESSGKEVKSSQKGEKDGKGEFTSGEIYNPRFPPKL
jgi:hypothetical protein